MLKSISKSEVKQKVCAGGLKGCGGLIWRKWRQGWQIGGHVSHENSNSPFPQPPTLDTSLHFTIGFGGGGERSQARGCLMGCLMRFRVATWIHSAGLSLAQSWGGWGVGGGCCCPGHSVQTHCETLQEAGMLKAADLLRASLLLLQTDSRDRAWWKWRQVHAPTQITLETSLIE